MPLDPAILLHWPAMELRFFHALSAEKQRLWTTKWLAAGGQIYDGRMIALKNDPIWRAMTNAKRLKGEAHRFMVFRGWDVTRAEAKDLGLLQPDEVLDCDAFDDEAPTKLTRKCSRPLDG